MNPRWMRKCSKCGEKQEDTKPDGWIPLSDEYLKQVCIHCNASNSLDYGARESIQLISKKDLDNDKDPFRES